MTHFSCQVVRTPDGEMRVIRIHEPSEAGLNCDCICGEAESVRLNKVCAGISHGDSVVYDRDIKND